MLSAGMFSALAATKVLPESKNDPDHAQELDDLLDRIELTDEQWLLVSLSAMNSVHMLAMVLKEIVQPAAMAPGRNRTSAGVGN